MEIILLLIRLFLAAIFLLAGISKLLDLEGSEKAVKDFGTPDDLAKTFAVALPFAEIVFGACFLFTAASWFGALGGLLLLLTFIGGMILQLAQGNAPDCHCFGAIHSEPVSRKSIIRNAVFAALAFYLILQGGNQGASLADLSNETAAQLIFGLGTVGLLGAAVFYLKRISEQQTQIMRRIEVLEVLSHEGGKAVEHEHLSNSPPRLPIGAPAPDFALPDLNGKQVEFEHLLAHGKPMIFFFVSPNCAPCAALLPEIEKRRAELGEKLNFIFISNGTPKENQEKFAKYDFDSVLLQNEREVAELFGARWTPTAWLINADGNVASAPAVGDKAILDLIEKIKTEIERSDNLLIAAEDVPETKINQTLPDFSLPDTSNDEFSQHSLRGKKTLVTFWSLSCGFCTQMIEELREWDKTKGADQPNLLLISEGEAEGNAALDLQSPILLDNDRKFSKEIGMQGTPSAILVDESGTIVSETAVGAEQIWKLIGKKS